MRTLPQKAHEFAAQMHAAVGQKRKYTGEPYIVHPEEVAQIVATVPHDEGMLAAAFLHDTVEDTLANLEMIETEFGKDVASLVEQLTDVSRPEDGNRQRRKEIDRLHTAKASTRAKTVKLADLISNSRTIAKHDPHFARVYFAEKEVLLAVLKEGDPTLLAEAESILRQYRARHPRRS